MRLCVDISLALDIFELFYLLFPRFDKVSKETGQLSMRNMFQAFHQSSAGDLVPSIRLVGFLRYFSARFFRDIFWVWWTLSG